MRAGPLLQVMKQTNKRSSDDEDDDKDDGDDHESDDNDDGDGNLSLDFPALVMLQ